MNRLVPASLRWVLVPLVGTGLWFLVVAAGLAAHSALSSLCPSDQQVSHLCVAPWFPIMERTIICMGAAVAAYLIVVACSVVAPSASHHVPQSIYAIGLLVAVVMAVQAEAWLELAAAAAGGWLGLRRVSRARRGTKRTG